MLRRYFYPFLIWLFYRSLSWTWRVRLIEPDSLTHLLQQNKTFVLAHWHGDELALLQLIKRYRLATIVSTSKDGELMAGFIKLQGGKISRGSSTRQAIQGLKGLIRLMKNGHVVSMAVDGPKGPIYQVKPGVFELSRISKAPIFAAGCSCDRAWHFPKSWNQTYLPKPFAKIIIHWLDPGLLVERDQNPKSLDLKARLESSLHESGQIARGLLEPKSSL